MVRDHAQIVEIIFDEGGLLSAQPKGKTIIVMSTLDPATMNELGGKVEAESGLKLVSAAVSGGTSGAKADTLSIMTSGSEAILKSFRPYFDAMGANIFFYGENPGNSQVAKLVNNMILGINMHAVAEGRLQTWGQEDFSLVERGTCRSKISTQRSSPAPACGGRCSAPSSTYASGGPGDITHTLQHRRDRPPEDTVQYKTARNWDRTR